jgi:peptidyl-prolyl cis-trans isomerase C
MKNTVEKRWSLIFIIIAVVIAIAGCGNTEEKNKTVQPPAVGSAIAPAAVPAATVAPAIAAGKTESNDIAVSVNGNILKKSELEKNVKERINTFKDKIPAEKIKEVRASMKKQLLDEYVMRILLLGEVEKRKVIATEKEIKEMTDQIKATLPPDKKLEAFMKENKISREDIALGIQVKKMIVQDLGKKAKPTSKEISKFYNDNKDKFIVPENVHVRHILVAFAEGDTDKVKAEKKIKIEGLRKQVTDGADFAEVARKNSDCPSKENGGDLGMVKKGQTVKPFEDAAFTQEIKVIGPVVATEYGYHVIQVLERNQPKTVALEEAKGRIAPYLEQQKQSAAFDALLKRLQQDAKIIVYDK